MYGSNVLRPLIHFTGSSATYVTSVPYTRHKEESTVTFGCRSYAGSKCCPDLRQICFSSAGGGCEALATTQETTPAKAILAVFAAPSMVSSNPDVEEQYIRETYITMFKRRGELIVARQGKQRRRLRKGDTRVLPREFCRNVTIMTRHAAPLHGADQRAAAESGC
ncbi:hypothetical protein E2C01_010360 [Portunus trituberculatus]|uniref:Uncharacterized protein n=1 Tax=Portunus trituberculatus TaxID=210409 RepID=A0A5B7D885_PORTR|nr:hypothetical protein [Portunus trituberculatus]